MKKPTKKQIEAFNIQVQQHWAGAVDSMSNDAIKDMAKRMAKRPSMILETQQRLQAIAWFCYANEDHDSARRLKEAGWILSAFSVAAKLNLEKEANNHEARGEHPIEEG